MLLYVIKYKKEGRWEGGFFVPNERRRRGGGRGVGDE